jgi:DNA-binding GntR family transcriptional regulator
MSRALADGRNEAFADLDIEFHRQLMLMSGRERLLQLWNTLTGVTHAFIVLNARNDPQTITEIDEGHVEIIEALARHDLAHAIDSVAKHLSEAQTTMLSARTKGMTPAHTAA